MDFTPTKEMRYANALRNHLQKRGAKGKEKQIFALQLYETVFCKSAYEMTVDVGKITDTLFGALFIIATKKGIKIRTQKGSGKRVKINVKLYEILLSSIVFSADKIFIKADFYRSYISIKFCGKIKNNFYKKIAALMGGVCLKDLKTEEKAVFIPVKEGGKKTEEYKTEIELISRENNAINLLSKIL